VRKTGIIKIAAAGAVRITKAGVEGDAVCDVRHHGGPDQAVYVYGGLDYDWWMEQLGEPLGPGTFGENLTIARLESGPVRIGDRLHINQVTLEVTAPRAPCRTLAARMQDSAFVQRFRAAERPGLYCRVLEEGSVRAGDLVRLEPYRGEPITILEMFRDHYAPYLDADRLRQYLKLPIAIRDRTSKEAQLAKLTLS
jgi:MOSC domain-containing protein YiiM